ncbi:tetratricopeptide (TPR) repeat protein [Dysgonomonas sp. PH5-45]|uniref:tetratricopeptide repeat protein n=1 Tax=unclassified Dysgonomonas TaxID=2630389 RepID=UPI002474FB62|nr:MULTISPECIES: tetratricopeptide repeat protein [unclassified Dysgonomonas]MDH6354263.1 tetratricopeptide (TPR) repeat protein [Dysgonomonas sp. PH5-45]MDH6387164.1 tetratricopeptide (TPR) repeat protein [Dysgonomonas sp. PH5-37]
MKNAVKHFLFIPLLFLLSVSASAQDDDKKFDNLMEYGIHSHDNGAYDEAIHYYKQALAIKPKSGMANYEIAYSYSMKNDKKEAIKYCDLVLKHGEKQSHQLAYILKGNCLDELGKRKESIKVYKKGIKECGDYYLLHFNLGCTYVNDKNDKLGEEAFIKAIELNPFHPGSNYQLGMLGAKYNRPTHTVYPLLYFLMLEPQGKRAQTALATLRFTLSPKISEEEGGKTVVHIILDDKSDFSMVDMMISMIGASKVSSKDSIVSESESFKKEISEVLSVVILDKQEDKKTNIWRSVYFPLFKALAKSEHMEAFCYYIRQSTDEEAQKWLDENQDKVKSFVGWFNNFYAKE